MVEALRLDLWLACLTKEAYLPAGVTCSRLWLVWVHIFRKPTYVLGVTRSSFLEGMRGRRQWGRGMGRRRRGGGGRGKRWWWGDKGWRGGARERAKIGWLMFYDTYSQSKYAVLCIIGGGGEGERWGWGGRGCRGRYRERVKSWLVDVV